MPSSTRKIKKTRNHRNYLYKMRNNYGLGIYTKIDLPEGTVIIKETPLLSDDTFDSMYCFKLIKKALTYNNKDFLDLVPNSIDQYAEFDDRHLQEGLDKFFPDMTMDQLKLYCMKYRRNIFNFTGKEGIIFSATRLNHSCEPNVLYSREGDKIIFKTSCPIKADEELFISYISCNMTTQERKDKLLKLYGFHCQCARCSTEQ
jgi:SET and MYND domain-containing protein